jgi:hypothetical protein
MAANAPRDGGDTILVDPPVAGETEPLLAALDEIMRGRVRIPRHDALPRARVRASVAALAPPARGHHLRA